MLANAPRRTPGGSSGEVTRVLTAGVAASADSISTPISGVFTSTGSPSPSCTRKALQSGREITHAGPMPDSSLALSIEKGYALLMAHSNVVAIINTSPDVVQMLRTATESAGYVVFTAFTHEIRDGVIDIERFIRQHQPKVIVYDIAPPYDANWQLFEHLRDLEVMDNRVFVLTSVSPHHVEKLAGPDRKVFEVVGKPFDLDLIVDAVHQALNSRPVGR